MENGFKVCALYKAGLCFQDNCEFLHPPKKGETSTPTPTKQQEEPQRRERNQTKTQSINQSEPQRGNQREQRRENKRESQHQDKKEICNFFAKTGTCKFGENCKYIHPEQTPKNDRKEKETKICDHFSKYGTCRYGDSCKFDHPTSSSSSSSKSNSNSNSNSSNKSILCHVRLLKGNIEYIEFELKSISTENLLKEIQNRFGVTTYYSFYYEKKYEIKICNDEDLRKYLKETTSPEIIAKEIPKEENVSTSKQPEPRWDGTFKSTFNQLTWLLSLEEKSSTISELIFGLSQNITPLQNIITQVYFYFFIFYFLFLF